MKRYSLDKRAPGMFACSSGGWVKYEDAMREIQAHRRTLTEVLQTKERRPRRLVIQNDPTRGLPLIAMAFECNAPGVDIDAIHRRDRATAEA